jgi:Holliday junction resolvasome RuvABC endonuclease subunit
MTSLLRLAAFWASPRTSSGGDLSPRTRTPSALRTGTSDSPTFSIGLDPGLRQAGIVLVDHSTDRVLELGVVEADPGTDIWSYLRAESVAQRLIEQVAMWCVKHSVRTLDIGIETPIYNHNPDSHAKQWRTVHAIQHAIVSQLPALVPELWVTEVGPSISKRLATGNGGASKAQILGAMMDRHELPVMDRLDDERRETIADAWAHSLCTYGRAGDRNLISYGR